MLDEPIKLCHDYIHDASTFYLDLIRDSSPTSFTRHRIISTTDIIYQVFDRKGGSQWSDIMKFYDDLNQNDRVSETAFYNARKKFNPEVFRIMGNEFIADIYDNYDDSFKKWKDNLVLATDGSKVILPKTQENIDLFGCLNANSEKNAESNTPVAGLLSTLYDCLNNTFLDVRFGPCNSSEIAFAKEHIEYYKNNYSQKAIFTFDRGYPSIRLIDQLIEAGQYFLFRLPSNFFSKYINQIEIGEDKYIDVTFDRKTTNKYRQDIKFRQHLMNTAFHLRFTKAIVGTDKNGEPIVEILLSNLPMEEFSYEDLMELYHLRWNIETSYNHLKNRMNLEAFSGYKPNLIYQDIYADIWMYNMVSLKIIYTNERHPLEEDSEYVVSRNFNKAVGSMKMLFIKALVSIDQGTLNTAIEIINDNIIKHITKAKKNRSYPINRTISPSSMSYKKTY